MNISGRFNGKVMAVSVGVSQNVPPPRARA
jgi:hypothetical protein